VISTASATSAPDPVLIQAVHAQIPQSGVLCEPDAVLGAGSSSMPQVQVGEMAARLAGRVLVANAVSRCPSASEGAAADRVRALTAAGRWPRAPAPRCARPDVQGQAGDPALWGNAE
jgi:hypothetical protein